MPSQGKSGVDRGYIIPIGGAEEKINNPVILQRFVEIVRTHSMNREPGLVVIPTASELDDTGDRYVEVFSELGISDIKILPIRKRRDGEDKDNLDLLQRSTAIFITGGNQLRLSTILGGTAVAQCMRRLNARGVHIAGTSAGAAIMPEHMIAGGRGGATPRGDGVNLAPGLGLINRLIIDQHFKERDRLGRLLTAVSYNPFAIGMGLDEDTAAFIDPDDILQAIGSGGITLLDPAGLSHSSMSTAGHGDPISLFGLQLHILIHGDRFDINKRTVWAGEEKS